MMLTQFHKAFAEFAHIEASEPPDMKGCTERQMRLLWGNNYVADWRAWQHRAVGRPADPISSVQLAFSAAGHTE